MKRVQTTTVKSASNREQKVLHQNELGLPEHSGTMFISDCLKKTSKRIHRVIESSLSSSEDKQALHNKCIEVYGF